jgi:hypothetical protein
MDYIMSPELFSQLSNVRGFTNMNGSNYQEHINMIFDNRLNQEDKNNILTMNIENALSYIEDLGITFTHSMTDV